MPFEYEDMGACRLLCRLRQSQQPIDTVGRRPRGQTAQLTDHHQVLKAAQVRIEMRLLGHVTHALLKAE